MQRVAKRTNTSWWVIQMWIFNEWILVPSSKVSQYAIPMKFESVGKLTQMWSTCVWFLYQKSSILGNILHF